MWNACLCWKKEGIKKWVCKKVGAKKIIMGPTGGEENKNGIGEWVVELTGAGGVNTVGGNAWYLSREASWYCGNDLPEVNSSQR